MRDYRENRKFALQVRDMVAAGQAEEARLLAVSQVRGPYCVGWEGTSL